MLINIDTYRKIQNELSGTGAVLVAVSKTKPAEAIMELYDAGQKDFGENYVQELCDKQEQLPKDIRWHFIGHLQRNKVKQILPFVHLIHGVDSLRLLEEINKQSASLNKKTQILLQIYIAKEESKYGLDENELKEIVTHFKEEKLSHIDLKGLMGMATLTDDTIVIEREFADLSSVFTSIKKELPQYNIDTLSMGMSGDYKTALKHGSTMIRIGSALFGERIKK